MGNRSCTGVLCYDVDPGRSVDESTIPASSRKTFSSLWGNKQELGDIIHEDDYIFHPRGKRRLQRDDTNSTTASPVYKMKRILSDNQKKATPTTSSIPEAAVAHDRPYSYHCRTMSSETAGREARTEHSLSRRSSTTTCEREDVQDEILSNRSS
jgi:hypothetical protein